MAWKQVKVAENKVRGHINEKRAQAIYKNYEADIEKAVMENKNLDEFVPQLLDEIKKRFPSNTLEIAQAMKDFNGTPEEIATRLSQEIETMTMGIQKESQVPIRTQWMSTVPQIYDIGKRVIDNGGTADDVFKAWQDAGLKIVKKGLFKDSKNETVEFVKRLEQAHMDAEYFFKGETGYLGSKKVLLMLKIYLNIYM